MTAPSPFLGTGRELRLPPAEPRWCDGSDRWHEGNDLGPDAWLRLTRFEGGRRGPVLLAPGFGMSATSFIDDTTATNLTEHLVAKGYDVWLFDYRSGTDLPSSRTAFTLDDVAIRDWPEAVAEVARVTGEGSVQALGHCVGSGTLMMALAGGLTGVRSAVCLQFPMHPVTSHFNRAKGVLRLTKLARGLGIRWVAPLTSGNPLHTLLDLGLRAVPMPPGERCGRPICRWVNSIYGCTHTHGQLDDATHDRIGSMFGVGNLRTLDHLIEIMRREACVDSIGNDTYLVRPDRLALPILMVQGELNYIFHPEGSARTLEWLRAANDPRLYTRTVLSGYAHLDALVGRNASRDVFPLVSEHLDAYN